MFIVNLSVLFLYIDFSQFSNITNWTTQPMLVIEEYHIEMPKTYARIFEVIPAYKSNYFMYGQKRIINQSQKSVIMMADKKGKITFQYVFDQPIESAVLINDHQAIVLLTRGNCIVVFDLQTLTHQKFAHHFRSQASDQSEVIVFTDRAILCVKQKGRDNDNTLKLSYYRYPFTSDKINKPICIYESIDDQWTAEYFQSKGNSNTMICWWKPLQDSEISFKTYELDGSNKGILRQYTINCNKINSYIFKNQKTITLQIGITHLYEFKKDIFFIVCLTNINRNQRQLSTTIYLMYDRQNNTLRQAHFNLGSYQDTILQIINIGQASIFVSYHQQNLKLYPAPTFYIDHNTQSIIGQQISSFNSFTYITVPSYCRNVICETTHTFLEVEEFRGKRQKLIRPVDMYMHVMVESQPYLDEDLMIQVLKLMHFCQNDI